MLTRSLTIGAALGALCSSALAHHSAAMFDLTKVRALEGVVTQFSWKNPHSYLTIRTGGPDSVEQLIEVGPPATLRPLGLTQDAVRVGDRVTVNVHPASRGTIVLGRELVKSDGSRWPLLLHPESRRPAPAKTASSIEGTWVSQGFFSMFGKLPSWPLTAKGRAHLEAVDPTDTSHVRCVPVTAPMLMLYPVANRIDVEGDVITMHIDWMDSTRVVYMDGRVHPDDGDRSLHGHSVGRWDGATLVIDTTGFADHSDGNFMFVPSGAGKRLIESLTLTNDRRHLRYEIELQDPEWLERPITHSVLFDYQPELEPSGLPCDRRQRGVFCRSRSRRFRKMPRRAGESLLHVLGWTDRSDP
jgi:hypothetical protein